MSQKTVRDEVTDLGRRLNLVEQTLELTVTWQYGLRHQADELLDALRADALDDTPARLDAIEAEIRALRRVVQDLTQVVVSGVGGFQTMPPPDVEPSRSRFGSAETGRNDGEVDVHGPAPRAMTLARFDGPLVRGESVGLVAVADGFADQTELVFEVGERGEAGDTLTATVMGGVARSTWWVPSVMAPGTEVALIARIPPFESHAQGVVQRGAHEGPPPPDETPSES